MECGIRRCIRIHCDVCGPGAFGCSCVRFARRLRFGRNRDGAACSGRTRTRCPRLLARPSSDPVAACRGRRSVSCVRFGHRRAARRIRPCGDRRGRVRDIERGEGRAADLTGRALPFHRRWCAAAIGSERRSRRRAAAAWSIAAGARRCAGPCAGRDRAADARRTGRFVCVGGIRNARRGSIWSAGHLRRLRHPLHAVGADRACGGGVSVFRRYIIARYAQFPGATRRRHRRVDVGAARRHARPAVRLSGRCLRSRHRHRPQSGHRSLFGRLDRGLEAQRGARSRPCHDQAGGLGRRPASVAARVRHRHDDLRITCARLLDRRQHRAPGVARQVSGLHRNRRGGHASSACASRSRHDRCAPVAGLRYRHHSGARLRHAEHSRCRVRQRCAAGRGRRGRSEGLLQLGLRPVSLQRARRQLRHRSRRRCGPRARVPRDGAGIARHRSARGHGRGLQPHHVLGAGADLGVRPHRSRLLPAPRRRRKSRTFHLLRQHRHRTPDDGEADDRINGALGEALPHRLVPLRSDGSPAARGDGTPAARGGYRGRSPHRSDRRGLELRRDRRRRAIRAGVAALAQRQRHRDVQRSRARRAARRRLLRQR